MTKMLGNFGRATMWGELAFTRLGAVGVQQYINYDEGKAVVYATKDTTASLFINYCLVGSKGLSNQWGSNITYFLQHDNITSENNIAFKLILDYGAGTVYTFNLKDYSPYIEWGWDVNQSGYIYIAENNKIYDAKITLYTIDGKYKGTYYNTEMPEGLYKYSIESQDNTKVHGYGWIMWANDGLPMTNGVLSFYVGGQFYDILYQNSTNDVLPHIKWEVYNGTHLVANFTVDMIGDIPGECNYYAYTSAAKDIIQWTRTGASLRYQALRKLGYTSYDQIPRDLILPWPDIAMLNDNAFEGISLEEAWALYSMYMKALYDAMSKYDMDAIINDANATWSDKEIKIGDIRGVVVKCDIFINHTLAYTDSWCMVGTWNRDITLRRGDTIVLEEVTPVYILAANKTTTKSVVINPDNYDVNLTYLELQKGDELYIKAIYVNGTEVENYTIKAKNPDDFDVPGGNQQGGLPWIDINLGNVNWLQIGLGVLGFILILYGFIRKSALALIFGVILVLAAIMWAAVESYLNPLPGV